MHTKSLATLRQGHVRRQLGKAAKEARGDGAANGRQHAPINGQATNSLTKGQSGAAGQPTNGVVDGQVTNGTGGGGAYAVISAMAAKSRAIGSSAADLLQKVADARCSNGAPHSSMVEAHVAGCWGRKIGRPVQCAVLYADIEVEETCSVQCCTLAWSASKYCSSI
jgi:hypothetical protein